MTELPCSISCLMLFNGHIVYTLVLHVHSISICYLLLEAISSLGGDMHSVCD